MRGHHSDDPSASIWCETGDDHGDRGKQNIGWPVKKIYRDETQQNYIMTCSSADTS